MTLEENIIKTIGTGMIIRNVPVNKTMLSYYLRLLEGSHGAAAVEKLSTLPKAEMRAAVVAIICGNDKKINSIFGPRGEDIMDNIDRSSIDVEDIGK